MGKRAIEAPRGDIYKVLPEDVVVVTDPKNPLYDERVHMPVPETLIRNIMAKGVLHQIRIRKNDEQKWEVVVGRQRVRATAEANRRLKEEGKPPIKLDATIVRGEDRDIYGVVVSENEHRTDDSPMAKAKKAQRMEDLGSSEEEICNSFGISKQNGLSQVGWVK